MDSQQTDLQYLQGIRDKIKDINFANYEGIKLAKELLTTAEKRVNSIIAEEGAKACYQEIIDIATQENLLKVGAKDFVEILRLVNDIMWRRDFNIQSTFIDQAIARFSEDNKQDFSTPSELLKLVVPISQMGFSAKHFKKSSEAMRDMVCKSTESAILGDKAVEVMASAMLHVKNIGFLDQDNAKAILTKINRYYSRIDTKTKRQASRSSEKDHQEKTLIVTPKLEREVFSNIFEIAAYYENEMSEGFKRRFFSTSNDLRLDTSDFQREIFEKIYQNIADGKKVAPEKDAQGRVTKVIIDDLIEIELEGKYCKIGKFFKAGDVVIRNKQTKEIISIIELDGKEHEARIDGVWVDRGKYFSRDKIIEKSCRIPLFIKHKDFADYNKDKDGFIAKLLQGVKLETEKDFAKEEARKKEVERQEVARRQAEEEREVARKQEEAKKKAEENQRQKLAIGNQAVDFLARANAEIIAKMQAAIEAAKAPSDPSESLQQYRESLQQQLSQLQAQINQIFANPAIERQEVQDEAVSSATASEDSEPPIMHTAVELVGSADLTMLDELEEGDEQEKSPESFESPESEDGVKKYNETEKEFAKHLLIENHGQVEWILKTAECDLNSFVFLDGVHQGKTAMQFAIETEDQDLVVILVFYNVKNLPEGYHPQSNHPFLEYLKTILAIAPEPAAKEPEVLGDNGRDAIPANPLSPNEANSESDDDRISKIVATISDSFERGDLDLFEDTIRNLDDAFLKRIMGEGLFSYESFQKMSLVSFVISKAMEENKLPDGFIKVLGELGFNFSSAEITAGKSAIKTLQYVANKASFGKVTDVANKIFDELASFGACHTILALALNQDTKGKFFLNRLQEKLAYQEILQAMTKIGKEAPVIMGSKMNEVGRNLINKAAIDGDDDLVKFFVQNYDLLVERS